MRRAPHVETNPPYKAKPAWSRHCLPPHCRHPFCPSTASRLPSSLKMQFTTVVQALTLALGASAASVPSPVDLIRRQHTTGTVITKCAKPGVLALAFDDGPGQCKQPRAERRGGGKPCC